MILGDTLKNISPDTVPPVFYSSLIFSLTNAFFAIYTSKAETKFSNKKKHLLHLPLREMPIAF